MKLTTAMILATTLLGAASADAMTVTYNTNLHSTSSTNWTDTLNFTQFDASLGTLTSIKITLSGNVFGTAKGESEDDAASTIVLDLGSIITLTRPDNTVIVITAPIIEQSFAASSFDDFVDYGGTSGVTYSNEGVSLSNTAMLTSAADLALFTGTGTIGAPVKAAGNSFGSGPGNLDTEFRTQAGASGSVEYTYTTGVPEPASWALMVAGLGMVGVAARRRKSSTATA